MVVIVFTDQQVVLAYGAESDRSLGIPGEVWLLTYIDLYAAVKKHLFFSYNHSAILGVYSNIAVARYYAASRMHVASTMLASSFPIWLLSQFFTEILICSIIMVL